MRRVAALGIQQRTAYFMLALFVVSMVMPGAAHASTYRFWNFWSAQEDSWVYSQLGPASTFPADGAVQGWVFAATDADSESVQPQIDPLVAFKDACGDTTSEAGQKRVALVIDSGSLSIAPEGQTPPALLLACAVGSNDASGYELLNSVTQLRTENGFICAINSYPAMECSATVDTEVSIDSATRTPSATSNSSVGQSLDEEQSAANTAAPLGTAIVIGLVAVAGFYLWRKRTT